MTDSTEFEFKLVPEDEMLRLCNEHDLRLILSGCEEPTPALADQGVMHHAFCCKIYTLKYLDPKTKDQVVTIDRQIWVSPKPTTETVRLLKIGHVVYLRDPCSGPVN
jgi:hypothetical protein